MIFSIMYLFVGMLPVFGVALQYIKMSGRKWFHLTILSFIPAIATFFSIVSYDPAYPVKHLYLFYGSFLVVCLYLLTRKYGYDNYSKILGITCLLTYVSTEWWEIPVFFCGHFGLLGKQYYGSINQIYLVASFFLLLKYGKFRFNKLNTVLLIVPIVVSSVVIYHFPSMEYAGSIWLIARVTSWLLLGLVFLKWMDLKT